MPWIPILISSGSGIDREETEKTEEEDKPEHDLTEAVTVLGTLSAAARPEAGQVLLYDIAKPWLW